MASHRVEHSGPEEYELQAEPPVVVPGILILYLLLGSAMSHLSCLARSGYSSDQISILKTNLYTQM